METYLKVIIALLFLAIAFTGTGIAIAVNMKLDKMVKMVEQQREKIARDLSTNEELRAAVRHIDKIIRKITIDEQIDYEDTIRELRSLRDGIIVPLIKGENR